MYEKTGKSIPWGESQSVISKLKKYDEYSFLKEVNSQSLQCSHGNLKTAFENFFAGYAGYPKYKRKSSRKAFSIPQNVIIVQGEGRFSRLFIPKFRSGIKVRVHRKVDEEVRQASIVQEPDGKYYVNIVVEREGFERYPRIQVEVGIDLGLTAFIIKDNGEKVTPPKFLRKMELRLVRAQRRLSKKRRGSKNRERMRHEVAVLHQKVKNQRQHFLHVQSSALIHENQVIYAEDLHAAGMMRNHRLAKSIADASWSRFITYLTYKAEWYGRKVVLVDRFAPTSKLCSVCGEINKELTLSDRIWSCKICQTEHDRDINAAKNIKKLGQGMSDVKPEERTTNYTFASTSIVGSKIQEPSFFKDAR